MCNACQDTETVIDVRAIAPRLRHPMIFTTFENLEPGECFRIVNDHDPRPLFYQFSTEYPGRFEWTYEKAGPEVWLVNIDRIAASPRAGTRAAQPGGERCSSWICRSLRRPRRLRALQHPSRCWPGYGFAASRH